MTDTRPDAEARPTAALAALLEQARLSSTAVPPIRDRLEDVADAYAVQHALTSRRIAAGAGVVGRKIGITSPAVQQQLGVDQPDFGVLFDDTGYATGAAVPIGRLLQPRVEAEVAFVLSADILDANADAASVRSAVDYAVGALEIVDSRITDWDISILDTIADNASSALFVLGATRLTLEEVAPIEVEMTMRIDGATVSTGNGAACLGDPLAALAWLARTAVAIGDPLRAGDVILSGALGPMAGITPGQYVEADLGALGTVSATFRVTEEES